LLPGGFNGREFQVDRICRKCCTPVTFTSVKANSMVNAPQRSGKAALSSFVDAGVGQWNSAVSITIGGCNSNLPPSVFVIRH
jgi:hypothetical protein